MTTMTNDVSPTQKALKQLTHWTVVLYLLLALTAGATFVIRSADLARVQTQSERNVAAFCALRHDVERRIEDSQAFLDEHPNGIPGIPPEQIRDSLRAQRETVRALSIVVCSD
jgi:uncharacterized ion transporter superfamily protein YfcC